MTRRDDAYDAYPDEPEPTPEDLAAPRRIDTRTLPARFHHLRAAGQSGAHCLHAFQGENPDTLVRRIGSGSHAMLLGKPWKPWDQPSKASLDRRAKVMKEIRAGANKPLPPLTIAPRSGDDYKKFVADNPGCVIMIASEIAAARGIVDAIKAHPIAARLLLDGDVVHERSIVWSQNGRPRQSTPDARTANGERHVELKTTRCAHPARFLRDAEKMGYHAQVADQRAAIAHETGAPPRHSYVVAVENVPPYVVQVYELAPSALDRGQQLIDIWLEKLQVYEATQLWGGYSAGIETWEVVEPMNGPIADPDWMTETPNEERQSP